MSFHKCHCMYVPPQVLENLARAGIENARLSLQQSKISRAQRSAKIVGMAVFAGIVPPGEGPRKVYDCEKQWVKRVNLVRDEGNPATDDDTVNGAYDYAGTVRDYFKDVLNRNSYDKAGSDMILNVHYGVNYMNAFWDGDELTFGDGDGTIFVNFIKSLDVVAHEFGHGVTQFTADLEYYSQSGALNEHFSDVFGSAITQFALKQDAGRADWLIGNEIMGPDLYGESLRSMKAPGTAYDNALMGKDPQPDHMKDYYTGTSDNQGVHINSGIPNNAFYFVAGAIGTDKATLIWYHALQNLWGIIGLPSPLLSLIDLAYEIGLGGEPVRNMAKVRMELSSSLPLGPLQLFHGKQGDGLASPVGASFTMDENRTRQVLEGIEETEQVFSVGEASCGHLYIDSLESQFLRDRNLLVVPVLI